MQSTQNFAIIELTPLDYLEKRMARVVELVQLAETMGFDVNGFVDENDLIRKIGDLEIQLLSDLVYKKANNLPLEQQFRSELRLEKFNALAGRILDALHS